MKSSYSVKLFLGIIFFFALIFISAGSFNYWQGWVFVVIGLIMLVVNITVLKIDSALLEERSKPGENTKKWDRTILGLSFLISDSMYVVAGLDSGRFHWSPDFHWSSHYIRTIIFSHCSKAE